MEGFDREVCRRLPLAEGVLRVLGYVWQEEFLETIFDRYRGRSYEDVISFPVLVELIRDALLEHEGSARQTFERAYREGELAAVPRAVYGKLSRIPLGLSLGLLAESVGRLQEIYPQGDKKSRISPLTMIARLL